MRGKIMCAQPMAIQVGGSAGTRMLNLAEFASERKAQVYAGGAELLFHICSRLVQQLVNAIPTALYHLEQTDKFQVRIFPISLLETGNARHVCK
jgi:hypothetical protein